MSEDNIKYGHQPTTPHPKRGELENKEEATRLFESYRLAHGMDNDNVRACLWRKAGVIEVIEHVLELISTREKELREEERNEAIGFATWVDDNFWVHLNGIWTDGTSARVTMTSDELYNLFTQSKTTDDGTK